jgi:hypothetical protein
MGPVTNGGLPIVRRNGTFPPEAVAHGCAPVGRTKNHTVGMAAATATKTAAATQRRRTARPDPKRPAPVE